MSHSTPSVVTQPQFHVVGLSILTTLNETFQQGTVKQMCDRFTARVAEIRNRIGTATYLVELYPQTDQEFTHDTPFTVIVGVKVESLDQVPAGMVGHTVPAGDFVKATHTGPETELPETYGYIYGTFLREVGRYPAGFDFEIWDERFKPESPENQIDVYVALRPVRIG